MVDAARERDGGAGASTRGGRPEVDGVDAKVEALKVKARMPSRAEKKALAVRVDRFKRGPKVAVKQIKDKKLRGQMQHSEKLLDDAASSAAKVRARCAPRSWAPLALRPHAIRVPLSPHAALPSAVTTARPARLGFGMGGGGSDATRAHASTR
jgi:hypothetical protein